MHDLYASIDRDPSFHRLQRTRSRFAWCLAAVVLGVYYGFILVIAFRPALFARSLYADTVVTVGVSYGLAIIVLSILLTGLYVWRANREFDHLNQSILDEATHRAPR